MAKEKHYTKEQVKRSLYLAGKRMKEEKPLSASRALRAALNQARFYEGPEKRSYLQRIERMAYKVSRDPSLIDYEYEDLQDIEGYARTLRRRQSISIEGLLPAIIGAVGLIAGLSFLSPNITGRVIGGLTNSTSNIIGIVLFVIGLIGAFFFFNSKK